MSNLYSELKRRNVFRVAVAYLVIGWLLLQITDILFDTLGLADSAKKLILALLTLGFIPTLLFSWAFELTPEGVKREKEIARDTSITDHTAKKLDKITLFSVALLLAMLALDRFNPRNASNGAEKIAIQKPIVEETKPLQNLSPVTTQKESFLQENNRNSSDKKSIAVLPFVNRSSASDDLYFTDGVHDDLLTHLSKVKAFSVISRTSVHDYRDTKKNLKQIASELGVEHIMEGAVQRAGNQVRINVQLIDAQTDEHLWAEIYDRELTTSNLFHIQSEIAQAISKALEATLTEQELATIGEVPTENLEAYQLYLQARQLSIAASEINVQQSIDLYQAAIELDPNFKLAIIGLAEKYMTNYWFFGTKSEDLQGARTLIDQAKAIDDDFGELNMAEGFYWYWGHLDYKRASEFLQKAIQQMPSNGAAYAWLAWASRRDGQWQTMLAAMREATRLNPRNSLFQAEYATCLMLLGKFEQARSVIEIAQKNEPENTWLKDVSTNLYINAKGDIINAQQESVKALESINTDYAENAIRTLTLAREFQMALSAVDKIQEAGLNRRTTIGNKERFRARIYYLIGNKEQASKQAQLSLNKLEKLQESITHDYRFVLAEIMPNAILGNTDKVKELADQYMATRPKDDYFLSTTYYELAAAFAVAELPNQSIEYLTQLLSMPTPIHANWIRLDPIFDSLRENPSYIKLMEQYP